PCNTVFRISVAHAPLLRHHITCRIDETADTVHGHQQLSLFNAHYDERCFPPLPVYDAGTGHCVLTIPRPGKAPDGKEVRAHPRCDRGARRRCSQSLRGGAEREGSANPSATDPRRVCRLRLRRSHSGLRPSRDRSPTEHVVSYRLCARGVAGGKPAPLLFTERARPIQTSRLGGNPCKLYQGPLI